MPDCGAGYPFLVIDHRFPANASSINPAEDLLKPSQSFLEQAQVRIRDPSNRAYRVLYRETHALFDEIAEATIDRSRKQHMKLLATVSLLIIDDPGMRKLPAAAEDLLVRDCHALL